MTKEEALLGMKMDKSKEEWLEFEKEFYETLSREDIDEIGAAAMPMVEICGYYRYSEQKNY